MSPEEIERTIQFLLQQQAQAAADSEKLSAKTDRIADGLISLTGLVGRVTETLFERMERLAEAQQRTDQQLKETDQRLKETGDHIKNVESHLGVVIDMFERHLREDHGQRPS